MVIFFIGNMPLVITMPRAFGLDSINLGPRAPERLPSDFQRHLIACVVIFPKYIIASGDDTLSTAKSSPAIQARDLREHTDPPEILARPFVGRGQAE
jgi:hypothetical protein